MLLLATQVLLQVPAPQHTLFALAAWPRVMLAEPVDLTHDDATAFCASEIALVLLVSLPPTLAA